VRSITSEFVKDEWPQGHPAYRKAGWQICHSSWQGLTPSGPLLRCAAEDSPREALGILGLCWPLGVAEGRKSFSGLVVYQGHSALHSVPRGSASTRCRRGEKQGAGRGRGLALGEGRIGQKGSKRGVQTRPSWLYPRTVKRSPGNIPRPVCSPASGHGALRSRCRGVARHPQQLRQLPL